MNRADRKIAKRLVKGGKIPTAYCPWDDKDAEICPTISTKSGGDYTKNGAVVIFEYEQPTHNDQQ